MIWIFINKWWLRGDWVDYCGQNKKWSSILSLMQLHFEVNYLVGWVYSDIIMYNAIQYNWPGLIGDLVQSSADEQPSSAPEI